MSSVSELIDVNYIDDTTGDYVGLISEIIDTQKFINICRVPRYFYLRQIIV